MDIDVWHLLPFVQMLLRVLLASVFFTSVFYKFRQPQHFVETISSYNLLPNALHKPIGFTVIGLEATISILLFIGWHSRTAAILSALLITVFSCAIGINLIRGRTNLDCGCFKAKQARKISLKLIGRNIVLLMVALCIILWGGGVMSLDSNPLVWKKLLVTEILLPFMLVGVGISMLYLLVRQLSRLLSLTPLEE